jgi:glycosyltransferase involved in cell wall biosynthesis
MSAKPRVLYLINGFQRGGAEKGLFHLISHGAFAGCELRVLSIIDDRGGYVEDIRGYGIRVDHLFRAKAMSIWQWFAAVPLFAWTMFRFRPHLVILSLPQANIAGRIASIPFPRIKVASFEHNTFLAKPLYEKLYRWTASCVDWLIADCEKTYVEVMGKFYKGHDKKKIVLPLVSFPKSIAGSVADTGTPGDPFVIINAARFTHVKNQRTMIEAVKVLKDNGRNVRLVLYGEGALLEECQKLADSLGVAERVSFPGFDPAWATHPADLFLVTSKHEGLCIVALEAMNAGIPVLATEVGGLSDYGPAAKVRFLRSDDPADIAGAVGQIMDQPQAWAEMRAAGLTLVSARFSDASVDHVYKDFSKDLTDFVH